MSAAVAGPQAAPLVCWGRSSPTPSGATSSAGLRFRTIIHEDGTVERWQKPRLADWEVPGRDPSGPRPQHPEVLAQRRRVQRRWRARRRAAREAASLAERESPELPATHDAHRVNFGA
jgi:hypothetical protein